MLDWAIKAACVLCRDSYSKRQDKDDYIPNYGEVCEGQWLHLATQNRDRSACGAQDIHEAIGAARRGEEGGSMSVYGTRLPIELPVAIQLQRILLVIAKWKAERDAKCENCKNGLDLGAHGCHFEDYGDESITVGNCKAWPLSRRIQQLEEAMKVGA